MSQEYVYVSQGQERTLLQSRSTIQELSNNLSCMVQPRLTFNRAQ